MANRPIPVEKILTIREMWDNESIRYIARHCEIGLCTAKKYGRMSESEVMILVEALNKKKLSGN